MPDPAERKTHLMATCADHPAHTPEAEPVIVEVDGDVARIEFDDGKFADFDRRELMAALEAA